MFGAHRPPRSALPEDIAEMISAWPMLLMLTSDLARRHLRRHDCTAYSPVELAVSTIAWPLMLAGLRTKPPALSRVPVSALPTDPSVGLPIVRMLSRA